MQNSTIANTCLTNYSFFFGF